MKIPYAKDIFFALKKRRKFLFWMFYLLVANYVWRVCDLGGVG